MTDARRFLCLRAGDEEARGTLRPGEAPPAGKRCGPAAWGGKAPHLPCGFGRILRSPLGQRPVFFRSARLGEATEGPAEGKGAAWVPGPRHEAGAPGADTFLCTRSASFRRCGNVERSLLHGGRKGGVKRMPRTMRKGGERAFFTFGPGTAAEREVSARPLPRRPPRPELPFPLSFFFSLIFLCRLCLPGKAREARGPAAEEGPWRAARRVGGRNTAGRYAPCRA